MVNIVSTRYRQKCEEKVVKKEEKKRKTALQTFLPQEASQRTKQHTKGFDWQRRTTQTKQCNRSPHG